MIITSDILALNNMIHYWIQSIYSKHYINTSLPQIKKVVSIVTKIAVKSNIFKNN